MSNHVKEEIALLLSWGCYENHEPRYQKVADTVLLKSSPLCQLLLELLKALFLLKMLGNASAE